MNDDIVLIYLPMQDMHLVPDAVFELGWHRATREELAEVFAHHSYMYIRYTSLVNELEIFFTQYLDGGISFHTQEAKDILFNILLEN